MDVRAVFELPVYTGVMREALGETYPTEFGQLRLKRRDAGGRVSDRRTGIGSAPSSTVGSAVRATAWA